MREKSSGRNEEKEKRTEGHQRTGMEQSYHTLAPLVQESYEM